ncbi:MAG: hypothetical protein QF704_06965 [Anaerolineales bacterium]|jgi:hypothetical protein|nr:hypothetical protein [Anaerolineales bacterium]
MGRVLRQLRHRSGQSRLVTYRRPPIFDKDDYGVEGGTIVTQELLFPGLPALIRPAVTADYMLEQAGHNIIGVARVYTPNIQTIKGFPNFEQTAAIPDFNEIEGWDRFIDRQRNVYQVPTSGTSGWTSGTADTTFTSDGQTITATLGADYDGTFYYTTGATNTLESDRLTFQIKASGASNIELSNFKSFNGGTQDTDYAITYTPASLSIPTGSWLTIDVPFVSGTVASGTSIYMDGVRSAVTVTSGSSFDYEADFRDVEFGISGAADGNIVYVRDIRFYKSIAWHVHSLKELNDEFMIFNTVRTRGKRDSRRRAY